jgi:hypothetical protein
MVHNDEDNNSILPFLRASASSGGSRHRTKKKIESAVIETRPGQQKSEFAIYFDNDMVFSRLEQKRFPDAEEIEAIFIKYKR